MDEKIYLIVKNILIILYSAVALLFSNSLWAQDKTAQFVPVDFSKVSVEDRFWSRIMELNRVSTIPSNIKQLEINTEHIRHFELAASGSGKFVGKYYDDSDVYKAIEGIAYSLKIHPDPALEAKCDEWIDKIAAAQWDDGYLNTYFSLTDEGRWTNVKRHEMYCAGHLIEGAIAYYKATGKRKLLDVSIRFADHLIATFGPGKRFWAPGHEEIELALVKLFELTGEKKYFDFAKWLIDVRGTLNPMPELKRDKRVVFQDDIPVRELRKADGHAVRAMYLYCGMADVASYTGDEELETVLDRLWESVVERNMYITGGIGSLRKGERFGRDWYLPNKTAYCETCAAVGMVLWNARMNRMRGESRYVDVLERSLYNGTLSGLGQSGDLFFYVNPLESDGDHHRRPWFGTPCCPSNLCRLLPSVGGYIYGESKGAVWVNLFIGSTAALEGGGTISMETDCPWSGKVSIRPSGVGRRTIRVRIPQWSGKWIATLGGKKIRCSEDRGYAVFKRNWKDGDCLSIDWDMKPKAVTADERVEENRGKAAVQMGPLVYCCEQIDNASSDDPSLNVGTSFSPEFHSELLGGVNVLTTSEGLKMIPYYAWDNRTPGWMKVWLPVK